MVAAAGTTPEREQRWRRLGVVEGFREREVARVAACDLAPGSAVVGDGLSCWPAVEKAGCTHRPMVTGSGRRAASCTPFRWVNTTLGNIETALAGACRLESVVERPARAAAHTALPSYRLVTAEA